MTKLLLNLFVKNHQNGEDPKVRAAVGRLSGFVGIICNIILCVGKLIIGTICGSVSITADAMNNLSDSTSAIVTLIGFKLAEKPADEDHPYGHARYEYLSGLAVAALILVIGVELARTSFLKILHPEAVTVNIPAIAVLVGSILVKLWLFLFNSKLGRHIQSGTLQATAADSRNDVISTAAVLAASLIEKFTGAKVDGYIGLAVAVFILYSGVNMGKETISPLLGTNASPELRKLILQVVAQEPRVLGYHDLMVHDYGPGQRFASLHVEMDQREDPLLCHELIDDMERLCLEQHKVHLVIHYDPIVIGDPLQDSLHKTVDKALKCYDARLSFHDFRMVKGKGHTNLVFDVAMPHDMLGQEKAIKAAIRQALEAQYEDKYYIVVAFDPQAFN